MKDKKPTLKEEFFEFYMSDVKYCNDFDSDVTDKIFSFFEPHLKKQKTNSNKTAVTIDIPLDKIKEFNELWPRHKLDTGKFGRCSVSELISAFGWFFKIHPEFTDWNIILQAASTYMQEREQENWNYTKRSKYFVRKQLSDKSFTSELSEYYERIRDGIQDEPKPDLGFEIKVY